MPNRKIFRLHNSISLRSILINAKILGTPAFITADRIPIIDYVAVTTTTNMKFIFRAPPLSYVSNVFVLPFNTMVWYACFVLALVTLFGIYIISKWEWNNANCADLDDRRTLLKPDFFDSVIFEMGAITQQGSDTEPRSTSGRIVAIFIFISLMFLYTAYSANVVVLLQSTTDSIRTPEDLLYSRMKLGVHDIVYAHYYFAVSLVAVQLSKLKMMGEIDATRKIELVYFLISFDLRCTVRKFGSTVATTDRAKNIRFWSQNV